MMSRPSIDRFQSATDRARRQTEGHTKRLAEQYATVIRRAGRRASRRFKTTARLAAFERLVAAGEKLPNWAVPPVDDLIDVVQVTQDLLGATEETRKAAATSAVRPITSTMGVSFSLEAPLVKELTAQAGARAAKLSIPGLRDVVFAAIKQAFEEGLSVDQTAALIYDKADHLAGYQAEMLARTDLIGTANGGSLLAAKAVWPQGGVVKRWVNATDSNTVNDGRIRPTHLEANGQEVPIDGHFIVGGARMLYPGDPAGPDEEVCNCRCTLVYHDTVTATAWDETKHSRYPKGTRVSGREGGGRFAPRAAPAATAVLESPIEHIAVDPELEQHAELNWDYWTHREALEQAAQRDGYPPTEAGVAEWKSEIEERLAENLDNTILTIRTPTELVDEIVRDGRFKSQFETQTSSGLLDNDVRANVERDLFGYEPDMTQPTARPIYGYLARHGTFADSASMYGPVRWELKRGVRDRTTWVGGDSLSFNAYVPSRLDDPKLISLGAPSKVSPEMQQEALDRGGSMAWTTSVKNPLGGAATYVEAQIHGGVTLDDVEAVVFPKASENIPYVQETAAELARRGISVEYSDE